MSSDSSEKDPASFILYYNVVQSEVRYGWDPEKEKTNLSKHGISFAEAAKALSGRYPMVLLKEDSQGGEERYVYLALSPQLRVLVIVLCYPEECIIRMISARKANGRERSFYEKTL